MGEGPGTLGQDSPHSHLRCVNFHDKWLHLVGLNQHWGRDKALLKDLKSLDSLRRPVEEISTFASKIRKRLRDDEKLAINLV
nr:hypothetical protein [Salmonella sp. S091_02751]